jgi:hypothetical protein
VTGPVAWALTERVTVATIVIPTTACWAVTGAPLMVATLTEALNGSEEGEGLTVTEILTQAEYSASGAAPVS